jgi:tetratricopeptide (TPR) repeat protein
VTATGVADSLPVAVAPTVSLTNTAVGHDVITATVYNNYSWISPEQFLRLLVEREAEVRRQIGSEVSAQTEKRIALEAELRNVQWQLANAETALEEYRGRLAATADQLEALREHFPDSKIDTALSALKQGRDELAEALLREAEAKAVAQSRHMLRQAGKAAFQQGVIVENRVQFRDALRHYSRATEFDPEEAAYASSAGFMAFKLGRYPQAEQFYNRAWGLLNGETNESGLAATILTNRAGLKAERGDIRGATEILEQVRATQERTGAPAAEMAKTLNNLGGIYQLAGRYDVALECYNKALRVREDAFGRNSLAVASTLNNIGDLYCDRRDLDESEKCHKEALGIREKQLPKSHPDLALSLNNLATVYLAQGMFEKAAKLLERALEIQRAIFGPVHHTVATTLNNLALAERGRGCASKAKEAYKEALAISTTALGADHPRSKSIRENLTDLESERPLIATTRRMPETGKSRALH